MQPMSMSTIKRLLQFGIVGGMAALTHYSTALICVYQFGLNEYLSNLVGFLVAFGVSYMGQSSWTFADKNHQRQSTLPRYFLTSVLGFVINATLLYGFMYIHLTYPVALLLAIIGAAGFVYLLSSLWVFRHHE